MKFVPSGNRVLVKVTKNEGGIKKTESGIIIPDAPNKEPVLGRLEAIGSLVDPEEGLEVGMAIQFEMYKGKDVNVDGSDYKLIHMDHVEGSFRAE